MESRFGSPQHLDDYMLWLVSDYQGSRHWDYEHEPYGDNDTLLRWRRL